MFKLAYSLGIVLSNLVPLAGVYWFGWQVFEVILLYWLENVAIWVTHYRRLLVSARTNAAEDGLSTAGFFLMHYGIFTFVHGIFVIAFFGVVLGGFADWRGGLLVPVLLVFVWQFIALGLENWQTEGFKGSPPRALMFQPYPRMFALHVTIIAGGWFIADSGSPIWAIVLLVFIKTAFDLGMLWFFTPQGNPAGAIQALRKPEG